MDVTVLDSEIQNLSPKTQEKFKNVMFEYDSFKAKLSIEKFSFVFDFIVIASILTHHFATSNISLFTMVLVSVSIFLIGHDVDNYRKYQKNAEKIKEIEAQVEEINVLLKEYS